MGTSDWLQAGGVFLGYPILIVATVLIAVGGFGFAWWHRNHITQRRVDVLDEQLKLARRQYEDVKVTVSELQGLVALQEEAISALRSSLLPTARVDALAQSNTEMQSALRGLANCTRDLGQTLTIAGTRYRLGIEPLTKKGAGS